MIPHCHHEYSYASHISSALKSIKVFNPRTTKSQREKLNSSQQDREGETPYDPTILTKPAIHQDHDISRTREREREREREIKLIATGTNPQPRGWTTPSIVVAAEMMKMATGDDSPLRQGAGTGSRLVFDGYRALRRRNL